MKKTSMAILLLAAVSCAGYTQTVADGAQSAQLINTVKARLAVIAKDTDRSAEQARQLAAALQSVDKTLAVFAPDSKLDPSAQSQNELVTKAGESETRSNLSLLRAGLARFFGENDAFYPATLAALVPKYIKEIPLILLADHSPTSEVIVLDKVSGKSIEPYLKDTGKWLYVSDKTNPDLYGMLIVDCAHTDLKGKVWSS